MKLELNQLQTEMKESLLRIIEMNAEKTDDDGNEVLNLDRGQLPDYHERQLQGEIERFVKISGVNNGQLVRVNSNYYRWPDMSQTVPKPERIVKAERVAAGKPANFTPRRSTKGLTTLIDSSND